MSTASDRPAHGPKPMHPSPPTAAAASGLLPGLVRLRSALIRAGVVVLLFSIAGYFLAEPVLRFLCRHTGVRLAAFGLPEVLFSLLTLALAFGVFAGFPYLLWAVLSGLQSAFSSFSGPQMRRYWAASVVLFLAGFFFCLRVTLPYGVAFLLEFEGPSVEALISVRKFVGFCLLFLFAFGILFELPLAMILLGRLGVLRRERLARNRRYALLGITIVSAVLTPTPDAFNLGLMAVPLYLLFEVGLLGMRLQRSPGAR